MASEIFQSVQFRQPKKSAFDLSHAYKTSFNMGNLIPIFAEEVLPGDQFRVRTNVMIKTNPLVSPAMAEMDAYVHYFFVPNRQVWEDWEEFITGGDPDLADPAAPFISITPKSGQLADYFGMPTSIDGNDFPNPISVSQIPFRAYQLIYNEWFRDQNIIDEIDIENPTEIQQVRKRALHKDYFTSATPEPQKGQPVSVPVEVEYEMISRIYDGSATPPPSLPIQDPVLVNAGGDPTQGNIQTTVNNRPLRVENLVEDSLQLDIIALRKASALQHFLEKDMIGGNRYREFLNVHFGVDNDDLRLQVPQYLGGGKQPVVISEVLNTAQDDSQTTLSPLGRQGGHAVAVGNINSFQNTFKEHGWVFGLLSVLPKVAYAQGLERKWRRTNRFEFYFHEFANVGEQEIYDWEVFWNGQYDMATNEPETFGYQQRYAEYKYACDKVTGEFRDPAKLGSWTLKRDYSDFGGVPTLSQPFIECVASEWEDQIFAAQQGAGFHNFFAEVENIVQARRPMPYFADYKLQ